jgi:hypothetical protein
MIIQPPKPGLDTSPEVRIIRAEGDDLAKRIAAMSAVMGSDAFKAQAPLDAHLFTLQMDAMRTYLHVLTIRLARANDRANSILPDTASALGRKPTIIKPGDIN